MYLLCTQGDHTWWGWGVYHAKGGGIIPGITEYKPHIQSQRPCLYTYPILEGFTMGGQGEPNL